MVDYADAFPSLGFDRPEDGILVITLSAEGRLNAVNAAMHGETPYPDGYDRLPKDRIGHVHCKDVARKPDGTGNEWAAMGRGLIDWVGQFRALKRDDFHNAISLETHWRGAGTAEESTRQSMAGMKEQLRKAGALS